MSNYRTTTVRLVNKCPKTHCNHATIYLKVMTTRSTPVHVANSTGTGLEQPATGRNARPQRNSAIPAAADPAKPRRVHVTAVVTGHGASNPKAGICPQKPVLNLFCGHDQSSEDHRPAQRLHGCRRSVRALDYGSGIPHLFSFKKRCSPVISGYFQRIYQNPTYLFPYRGIKKTGKRLCQSVPFCPQVPV